MEILNKKGIFDVGEVLDGVITFENSDDAERFQSSLEAEGHAEVCFCVDFLTILMKHQIHLNC